MIMQNDMATNFMQLLNPDNTMSFNRLLAHAIGANETIIYFCLISKMTYYDNKGLLDEQGFFFATAPDIQESTTFTQRQQAPAIKKLVELGLIEAKLKGVPAKKHYRIIYDPELILNLLAQGKNIAASIKKQNLSDVKTSFDKMSKQDLTKCQNKIEQNVETSFDKMSNKSKYNNLNINNLNINNQSINQYSLDDMQTNEDTIDRIEKCRQLIKTNIDYDMLIIPDYKIDVKQLNGIVELMTDIVANNTKPISIGGNKLPAELVKSRLLKLTSSEIVYVLDSLSKNTTEIRNIRAYLLTALYNSPTTIDAHYMTIVHHDMALAAEEKEVN